jgi:HPr kinase/phosphorylase
VRDRKKIELVIELVDWAANVEYDRLGLDQESMNVVGVELPHAVVPVRPGRNMTTIVEVAARNHLLKLRGHNSAQEFADRLSQAIATSGAPGRTPEAAPVPSPTETRSSPYSRRRPEEEEVE